MEFVLKNNEIFLNDEIVAYKDLDKWLIINEKDIDLDIFVELKLFIADNC